MRKKIHFTLGQLTGRLFTRGLTQTTVLRSQWASGFLYKKSWFNFINFLPLLAFGPIYTVQKNKFSDKKWIFR